MLFGHLLGFRRRCLRMDESAEMFTIKHPCHQVGKKMGWCSGRRPTSHPEKLLQRSTGPLRLDQYPSTHGGIGIQAHVEVMVPDSCSSPGFSLTFHCKQLPDYNPVFPRLILSSDHGLLAMQQIRRRFPMELKSRHCHEAQKLLEMQSFTAPVLFWGVSFSLSKAQTMKILVYDRWGVFALCSFQNTKTICEDIKQKTSTFQNHEWKVKRARKKGKGNHRFKRDQRQAQAPLLQ